LIWTLFGRLNKEIIATKHWSHKTIVGIKNANKKTSKLHPMNYYCS